MSVLRDIDERDDQALSATAESRGMEVAHVRLAARYYAAHAAEIDLLIDENARAADEALSAWQAEQQLLR